MDVGTPVFLTKNGRGKYATLDMWIRTSIKLMNELTKGRKSDEEEGWLTVEEVDRSLGLTQ